MLAAGAASVALVAVEIGFAVLSGPSADFDGLASSGVRTWGGLRRDEAGQIGNQGFRGTGTLVGTFSVRNRRDHAVVVSVPSYEQQRLAMFGIRRSVLFVPFEPTRGSGGVARDADLARGSTTVPAHAEGEIVQVFRADRCQRPGSFVVSAFPLEVDGHAARVLVGGNDGDEVWTFERAISDIYGVDLAFGSCCRVDRLPTEEEVQSDTRTGCVGARTS